MVSVKSLVWTVLVVLVAWQGCAVAAPSVLADNPACYYIDDAKKIYFNLNVVNGEDYYVDNPSDNNFNFLLSPCSELSSLPVNQVCPSNSHACQMAKASNSPAYLVGKNISSVTYSEITDSVSIRLTGGDFCPGNGNFREAVIVFSCGNDIGHPLFVSENACSYQFSWTSKAGCKLRKSPGGGSSGGLSAGSILCIIFFVSVVVYLVLGSAYNYKIRDARGAEMIPNIDFWRGLPSLIRDGFSFTRDKLMACMGRQ